MRTKVSGYTWGCAVNYVYKDVYRGGWVYHPYNFKVFPCTEQVAIEAGLWPNTRHRYGFIITEHTGKGGYMSNTGNDYIFLTDLALRLLKVTT